MPRPLTDALLSPLAVVGLKTLVVLVALIGVFGLMTWVERRVCGVIQFRWGPNRVGPLGLLQPIADGVKLLFKEEVVPRDAYKPIFIAAPAMALITSLCAFAVVPFGPTVSLLGRTVQMVLLDLDGGLLYAYAATSLGVYGIVCAGWSSRSKYALVGGLRSSAQMISYELAMGLALVGVVLTTGTLRPVEIVNQQVGWFWNWHLVSGAQLLGFVIFMIAGYAETNRLPFDLPEAESELVAGYHTEYSSMKFSMFLMAEYIAMTTMSGLAVTLFLGGYHPGFPLPFDEGWLLWGSQMLTFVLKVAVLMFVYVWVRWTLPRFRYDQLMNLGWKALFPLALANLFIIAALVAFGVI